MPLRRSLVAEWLFAESGTPVTWADTTERGNDLTNSNAAQGVGPCGLDALFIESGTAKHAFTTTKPDLAFTDEKFEIEVWIKVANNASLHVIFGKGVPANDMDYYLLYDNSDGALTFWVRNEANSANGTVEWPTPLVPGQWYNVHVYHDSAANEIGISVNNAAFVTLAWTGGVRQSTGNFTVGTAPDSSGHANGDTIAALRVWKGRLLTASERTTLYNSGCPLETITTGEGCTYIAFGGYEFSNLFHVADLGRSWNVPTAQLARADGARDQTAYREPRRVIVRGALFSDAADLLASGSTALRDKVDDLAAALAGQPQDLYIQDDRYFKDTRVRSMPEPYSPTGNCRYTDPFDIEFLAADPFQYSVDESNVDWDTPSHGEETTVENGGNAYAWPVISFTLGGSGSEDIDFTLTNETTGQAFRLLTDAVTGSLTAGDVIEVDTQAQRAWVAGDDRTDLFDGQWTKLAAGVNTWSLSITTGVISNINFAWAARWH